MTLILTVAQLRTLRDIDGEPALCSKSLNAFAAFVGGEDVSFSALELAQSSEPSESIRCYQALVNAGMLPDTGLVWRVARMAFAATPERLGLRHWTETLSAKNWQGAYNAARTIARAASVALAYDAKAVSAAASANAAAFAASAAAYSSAYASYTSTFASASASYTDIRAMVVAELEATQ